MTFILILFSLLVLGAWAGPGTLLHTFAVAFDVFGQSLGYDSSLSITISSRAGLAARNGNTRGATIINTLFFNKNHCEGAIASDLARASATIKVLEGK